MSKLEDELASQLEAAGLPFVREFKFCDWRRFRADFRVDEYSPDTSYISVLVEVQGFSPSGHHGSGFSQAHSDAEKLSLASCLGYRTIHATGKQVRDGSCLTWIRVALGLTSPETLRTDPKPRRSGARIRSLAGKTPVKKKAAGLSKLPDRVKRAANL